MQFVEEEYVVHFIQWDVRDINRVSKGLSRSLENYRLQMRNILPLRSLVGSMSLDAQ